MKHLKMNVRLFLLALPWALLMGCQNTNKQSNNTDSNTDEMKKNSFGEDVKFLKDKDSSLVVLTSYDDRSRIVVSPKYQGKVFTSTANGEDGLSFGWINYDAFDGEPDSHMNAYGGEDRLWLGPEGGPYSLYFEKGKEMVFDNWHTPPAIDTEDWKLVSSSEKEAYMVKDMELPNYMGTILKIGITRRIQLLEQAQVEGALGIKLEGEEVEAVAFKTVNSLRNTGDFAWDEETGAPCLWNLDMFNPTPQTTIVIPYEEQAEGKIATTDYFGEISEDRIKMVDGVIYFKADGLSRGKLGVPPHRVKPVAGSYAADDGILTLIRFDTDKDGIYLNQEWTTDKDPFTGDAMNAYNDGPLEDGSQMGPFLELESVSPAAFIEPNTEVAHSHSVFHFTGDKEALNKIAVNVLGITLDTIEAAFN